MFPRGFEHYWGAASEIAGKEDGSRQTVDQAGGQSQAPHKVDKPNVAYIKEILTSKGLEVLNGKVRRVIHAIGLVRDLMQQCPGRSISR